MPTLLTILKLSLTFGGNFVCLGPSINYVRPYISRGRGGRFPIYIHCVLHSYMQKGGEGLHIVHVCTTAYVHSF